MGDTFKFDIEKEYPDIKDGWFDDIEQTFNNEVNIKKESYTIQKLLDEHDDDFCTPKKKDIFNAFTLFPLEETRVLILGQDPYPDKDKKRLDKYGKRAHGLAFSFANTKEPAADSLKNIFNAINKYLSENKIVKTHEEFNTNLRTWAKNSKILLLNTALTYDDKLSHEQRKRIWQPFIIKIIYKLLTYKTNAPIVIFLWGNDAQDTFNNCLFSYSINCNDYNFSNNREIMRKILVLQCSHPKAREKDNTFKTQAPLQFAQCNAFLKECNANIINWQDI